MKDTPAGTRPPRTALPMPPLPPVASAHSARANNPGGGTPVTTAPTQSGWTMLDGRRARAADYRGKVLILDFWATYCPPCREEVPHLITLQRRFGADGLQVVGLNVGGEDDRPLVPRFVEQYQIQYPLGYPDQDLANLVFADDDAIPQTYVFDRAGRLVKRFVGYDAATRTGLEQAVQTALTSKAGAP